MARRSFAPALRALFTPETKTLVVPSASPTQELALSMEEKVVSMGTAYSSMAAVGAYSRGGGLEDRASGYDLEEVVINGYESVVWVYRAVEFYSNHFSRLPFVIGKNRGTEQEERLTDHPLYRVLNRRANPLETGRVFRKRLSAQVLLSKKGAFVEVTKSRTGQITRLDLLTPSRVLPIPDPANGEYLLRFDYTERNGNVRPIDPARVRWIRDPHPFDPFSGITPVDPAGTSIELDRLYRAYQSSFIKNDARPSGIVGVDADTLSDEEMRRVEGRFAPGAHNAGMVSVIATGPGGLKYVDTSSTPRDLAYGEGMQLAKETILAAFGLSESLFGATAGRTFDNAEQDLFNAWTEHLVPHFDVITSVFDVDIDEEWEPYIDTSTVAVLELPLRKKREEMRAEVEAGLRSVNEYRPHTKLEPVDNAYARALWISPSKAPIPMVPEDATALGLTDQDAPVGPDGQPIPGAEAPLGQGATDAAGAVAEARAFGDGTAAAAVAAARGEEVEPVDPDSAEAAVTEARGVDQSGGSGEAAAAVEEARDPEVEGKALEPGAGGGQVDYTPTLDEARRAELAIAAAMDAMLVRQQAVIAARMESPKTRKGTRFWEPTNAQDLRFGNEPIDTAKVVDEERWVEETTTTLQPLVEQYAVAAGAAALAALAAGGVVASAPSVAEGAAEFAPEAAQASAALVLGMVTAAGESMRQWLRDVDTRINTAQMTATTVDDVVITLRSFYAERVRLFSESLSIAVAHGTVNGAREAAVSALTPFGDERDTITREWESQRDGRVRPTHVEADGQVLPVGSPFVVGGFLLRYPQDPLAPAAETRNCRCFLRYRVSGDARFLLPPVGA